MLIFVYSWYTVRPELRRGNNWAEGYFERGRSSQRDSVLNDAIECMRRCMEAADAIRSVSMYHSLSGGTGSGLGSRLLVELRDRGFRFDR